MPNRRGDARAVDRRAHQRLGSAPAFAIKVARRCAQRIVVVQRAFLATDHHGRIYDPPMVDHLAVDHLTFVHDLDFVAGLQVPLEIDVETEYSHQLLQHRKRQPHVAGRLVQAGVDGADRAIEHDMKCAFHPVVT